MSGLFSKILGTVATIAGGPLGGVAGSIIGGLLDNRSSERTRADDERRLRANSYTDFARLRDDALKGGFNPLTALTATGAAAYDMRGSVLSTPHSPIFRDAFELGFNTQQQQQESARAFMQEQRRLDILERELNSAGMSGSVNSGGSPFGRGEVTQEWNGTNLATTLNDMWSSFTDNVSKTPAWDVVTGFGERNVSPTGPDFESQLSGIYQQSLLKAKSKGGVPKDVEVGIFDSLSDFGSDALAAGYLGAKVIRRLGGWSYW